MTFVTNEVMPISSPPMLLQQTFEQLYFKGGKKFKVINPCAKKDDFELQNMMI